MSDIHPHMSIPEFLDTLSLDQLYSTVEEGDKRINKVLDQDKVDVWIFHSGVVNEGFYRTSQEAAQALVSYVNSKEYSWQDKPHIFKIRERLSEAERLLATYGQ